MTAPESTLLSLPTPTTPVAEAAEIYVRMLGLAPVRLYGLTRDGLCTCSAGASCPKRNRGKHPIGNGWQKRASVDVDDVRDAFRGHTGNVGLYLSNTHVVIDADGSRGLAAVAEWALPDTLTAQSGSGEGAHHVFALAPHHDATAITDRRVDDRGIDVKVRGQFVVCPSRHASGGVYRWAKAVPIATLSDDAYDRIRKREPASATHSIPLPTDPDAMYRRAAAYIERIPGAVSGSRGHDQTFAAARALAAFVDKGLPEHHAWGLLCEYNRRCEPPWSERELQHKWAQAQKAHSKPVLPDRERPQLRAITGGASSTPPAAPPPTGTNEDWLSELLWKESRKGARLLVSHVDNVVRILQMHPEWKGVIRFDTFRCRIMVNQPPWDEYQMPSAQLGTWTDEDTTRLSGWLRRQYHRYQFEPSRTDCEHAVAVVARGHDYNPVAIYLDSVVWDGTSRLGSWLSKYLGAEVTEYTRLVGSWWLISAVARVYQPGCKVDTVPILEGRQGIRKSSALRLLAGDEFFSDTPIDLNSKDAYSAIQGCWFVELAELESLMRAEPSRSKAFFSSAKDRFRRAYARHEREELRQCIFVGTVNLTEYLSDPTGARRFWPIPCGAIDLPLLERDRDQIWAEAVAEYREGRVWYPQTDTEYAILRDPQSERTQGDAWEVAIDAWCRKTAATECTTVEILRDALGLKDLKDWTRASQTRVGQLLTARLGWSKRRRRTTSGYEWYYERLEQ